jgi:hypothetical protein
MAFLHSRTPLLLLLATAISALALHQTSLTTRRGILLAPTTAFVAAAACLLGVPDESLASSTRRSSTAPDLVFATAPSDLQYADAKVGTGQPVAQKGSSVTIDYVMSTTGARYGSKIYSTADKGSPYKFNLGDGTTIAGLQEAIAGGPGVNPMQPGGIRRVIIPSKLAYESLAYPIAGMQVSHVSRVVVGMPSCYLHIIPHTLS